MEKEFVPYDRAFKLKALGFNQPCFGGFNDAGGLYIQKLYFQSEKEEWCLAPTFSQAFRWFRKEQKFYIIIQPSINNDFSCIIWTSNAQKHIGVFKDYEKAELACLDKLIEIVENR